MRFIHTADWHLGRLFHGVHLTGDQHHALMQLVDLVKQERPDAVLVAGDIYDRAIPPPEAVELLDEVLCRLVIDLKVPVVLIAGNHDSPQRLHFGSRLLADRRLYVAGGLPGGGGGGGVGGGGGGGGVGGGAGWGAVVGGEEVGGGGGAGGGGGGWGCWGAGGGGGGGGGRGGGGGAGGGGIMIGGGGGWGGGFGRGGGRGGAC